MRGDCPKQKTRCVVKGVRKDAIFTERWEATNSCEVQEDGSCARIAAGCATGEGYELCGSRHAEVTVAEMLPDDLALATAYLYGHDWFCGPCQKALTARGVRTFQITGERAW